MQNRKLHKFIIITIIVPLEHDSVVRRDHFLGDALARYPHRFLPHNQCAFRRIRPSVAPRDIDGQPCHRIDNRITAAPHPCWGIFGYLCAGHFDFRRHDAIRAHRTSQIYGQSNQSRVVHDGSAITLARGHGHDARDSPHSARRAPSAEHLNKTSTKILICKHRSANLRLMRKASVRSTKASAYEPLDHYLSLGIPVQ